MYIYVYTVVNACTSTYNLPKNNKTGSNDCLKVESCELIIYFYFFR